MHVWTIEVNGELQDYKSISFDREDGVDPTSFNAIIKYNPAIKNFHVVEIKNNGVVEWYGYVESIDKAWDISGKWMEISGRSRKVLLWKMFNERFTDTRTSGFFGYVDPAKLIKFLLRRPKSDNVTLDYQDKVSCESHGGIWDEETNSCIVNNHKMGWGINSNKWVCTASSTAEGTSPMYVKSRLNGFSWGLGGKVANNYIKAYFFGSISDEWHNFGNGSLSDNNFNTGIITPSYDFNNEPRLTENVDMGQSHVIVEDVSDFNVGDEVIIVQSTRIFAPRHKTTITSINGLQLNLSSPLPYNFYATASRACKRHVNTQEYYMFEPVGLSRGKVFNVNLNIFGSRNIDNPPTGYASIDRGIVDVYIDTGSGWVSAGSVTFDLTDIGFNNLANIKKSLNISSFFDTLDKFNACKVKLVAKTDFAFRIKVSEMSISFDGLGYQSTNDYFQIDMNENRGRVCGLYFECRGIGASENYARNYKIEVSSNGSSWTTVAEETNNKARDIIESWEPIDSVRYIRIMLTDNYDVPWEISQIYVYQAENRKYCLWSHGNGATLGPYLSGNFISDDYVNQNGTITPINLSIDRLNVTLQEIVDKCHDVNYDTWELWIDHLTGDVYFKERKGVDKSSTIIFKTSVTNESFIKHCSSTSAQSRVKTVGKSESKKSDEVTSDWQTNSDAETELGTFYENIISSKKVSNKSTANVIAAVTAKANGKPEETYELPISYDPYEPLAYDCGDDVTVIDSITGTNDVFRIKGIHKEIGEDGEKITLYISTRWKDVSDDWAETKRELREIGVGSTIIEDWLADGANQNKIDINKVTDTWDKTAKNDDAFAPSDKNDGAWVISGDGVNSQELICYDQWFVLKGSKVADGEPKTLIGYVKNTESNVPNIKWDCSPRFVCDFKIPVSHTNPSSNPTIWSEGDSIYINMSDATHNNYFGFQIKHLNGVYNLYFGYKTDSSETWIRAMRDVDGTAVNIEENVKYRLEAKLEWETLMIKFMLNNVLVGIVPVNPNDFNITVFPIYTMLTTNNSMSVVTNWSQIYIYKYKSEWEWTQ